MAKSIQTVNGHDATFNDVDLLVVVRMVLSSMTEAKKRKLATTVETLEGVLAMHAPGVVDLRMQDWVNDGETRSTLISLLANIETSLSEWGDAVPLAHLKEECRIPGVIFEEPYPTRLLAEAARQLRQLIARGREDRAEQPSPAREHCSDATVSKQEA